MADADSEGGRRLTDGNDGNEANPQVSVYKWIFIYHITNIERITLAT